MKNTNKIPVYAVIFTILFKLIFLATQHIQEDALITWRVAQNLLDYGVIGFNGEEKISSSTTHLYMFTSYFFNLLFGKINFVYPLLIFNSILFTIGSYLLSKVLLKDVWHQAVFIFLFGILPPSIKISILGMEYGLLFFLEMSLIYFGFFREKKWALILFPILILFARIDTVIFLGIVFLVDLIWTKKIRWSYILGGILGLGVVFGFNSFYFHEVVNNTIDLRQKLYHGTKLGIFLFELWKLLGNDKASRSHQPDYLGGSCIRNFSFHFHHQKERRKKPFSMDGFYFWLGKTVDIHFTKKPIRLVLLGTTNSAFCPYFDLDFGTRKEEKTLAFTLNYFLHFAHGSLSNRAFYRHRQWRVEL